MVKIEPGKKLLGSYELIFELASGLWNCQNSINQEDLLGRPSCKN